MEDSENKVQQEKIINSKCPNCGATLKFDPKTNKLVCDNCDSSFEIESIKTGKLDDEEVNYADTIAKLKASTQTKRQRVIHCQDCGGLIILNDKAISSVCPYCGSNKVVLEDKDEEVIKINGVVPFAKDEKDVTNLFKGWIKKRYMAPRKFRLGRIIPSFSGIYIPFYTFDSDTSTYYTGYRGDYYYETRTVRSSDGTTRTEQVRKVRWTYRSGHLNRLFDDVLVVGAKSNFNPMIHKVGQFDFNKMQAYKEEFLLGYYTEKPSLTLEDAFKDARQKMMEAIKLDCIRAIGGDTYRDLNFSSNFTDVTFKQIMLPMYTGFYSYKDKRYMFICNGQSGAVVGKAPVSPLKVTGIVIGVLALIALIFVLVYFYVVN